MPWDRQRISPSLHLPPSQPKAKVGAAAAARVRVAERRAHEPRTGGGSSISAGVEILGGQPRSSGLLSAPDLLKGPP